MNMNFKIFIKNWIIFKQTVKKNNTAVNVNLNGDVIKFTLFLEDQNHKRPRLLNRNLSLPISCKLIDSFSAWNVNKEI